MTPYVVRQGESLSTLSLRFHFDAESVWSDPSNQALRQLRTDADVLNPGDVLCVPEPARTWLPVQVGAVNRFVGRIPTLHAHVQCVDQTGAPISSEDFEITSMNPPITGTTGGDGTIDLQIPADQQRVRIHFPKLGLEIVASPAHLDPVTESSGVDQRLAALGVVAPAPPVVGDEARAIMERDHRASAIRAFQSAQGLAVTGEIDDATREALVDAHGA